MGQTIQKIPQEELEKLSDCTGFTIDEIRRWSGSFLREYPRGIITKAEFRELYQRFFPFGDSTDFADMVFGALKAPSGYIDNESFLKVLSIVVKGSLDQKIEWIFKVYDNKGDGYLDREELMPAIEAAYKVSQCMDDLTGGEESPESRLERILSLMDPDRTGKITLEKLKEGYLKDNSIMEGINLYCNLSDG